MVITAATPAIRAATTTTGTAIAYSTSGKHTTITSVTATADGNATRAGSGSGSTDSASTTPRQNLCGSFYGNYAIGEESDTAATGDIRIHQSHK